jgi:hypothetical protein
MSDPMLEVLRRQPERLDDLTSEALARLIASHGLEPHATKAARIAQMKVLTDPMLEVLRSHPEHLDDLTHDALVRLLEALGQQPQVTRGECVTQMGKILRPGGTPDGG